MANMLERVAKLLAQAENAGTPEEADTFMAKAQEVASANSIDLAKARHATIDKRRTLPVQRDVFIGDRGTRGLRTLVQLYSGIAAANDIRMTIAHNSTRVYAVGFAEDLDVAEAMFASLQVQMAKAAEEFRAQGSWKSDTMWSESKWRYVPVTWLTARLDFQQAYAVRIGRRLRDAKWDEESRREMEEAYRNSTPHMVDGEFTDHFRVWAMEGFGLDVDGEDDTSDQFRRAFQALRVIDTGGISGIMFPDDIETPEWMIELFESYVSEYQKSSDDAGTALVLVEKRDAVEEAFKPLSARARGTWRGGRVQAQSASAVASGIEAASRAQLGGSTAIGGTRGAIGA